MSSDGIPFDPSGTRYLSDESGCPTCGAARKWQSCDSCGGEGGGYSYEEDRAWCRVTSKVWESCARCHGYGGWWRCDGKHEGRWCWTPKELKEEEGGRAPKTRAEWEM